MSKNFKPLHEQIAAKLIAALEAGTSPFQKPWNDSDAPAFTIPINPTTDKNYRGMNSLWLSMQGHSDPRWMTLKQASFEGYTVEKGAKATLITFVKKTQIEAIRDEQGEKKKDSEGKVQTHTTELDKPMVANAFVFNAEQIKGIPPLEDYLKESQGKETWTPIERAENLIKQSNAAIIHGGNEAYYTKFKDEIHLPLREQFDNATKYYAVALHEIGHWTGHESRMNRPMQGRFGSEAYAREELRAEIASLMLGSELKIGHQFGQHAAYVQSWVKILQDEPYELFRASADAQKIMDFMMELDRKREVKQDLVPSQFLEKGEEIAYKNTIYKVADIKGKTLHMEDLEGNKFKLKQTDGLYKSLLAAKNNPEEQQLVVAEQEEKVTRKIGR